MQLNGIDIASHQAGIVPSATAAEFVIIKATGGVGYVNDRAHGAWKDWEELADEVLASGKLLGLYHYANERGCSSTAAREAEFFLNETKAYHGKFVPVLDWEADALMNPPSWAHEWLQLVESRTKSRPMFYGGASNVNNTDYSSIVMYPLWMASYLNRYQGVGFVDNPVNTWDTGDWPDMLCYQYTSTGRIAGYSGNLDLSAFYGTRKTWQDMCSAEVPEQKPGKPINNAGLYYTAHVQNIGWCKRVRDGQVAGTTGFYLRLEALRIDPPKGWALRVKVHVQGIGWTQYDIEHGNDTIIGTVGEYQRIEMLEIDVTKRPAGDKRKLRFRVHQEYVGWKAWTDEGYASGSDGLYARLEAVQIVIE